jgi:hypothetical protein
MPGVRQELGRQCEPGRSVTTNRSAVLSILCWIVLAGTGVVRAQDIVPAPHERAVTPTAGERAWLAAHPDITLGYTDSFEPQVIVNPDGSYPIDGVIATRSDWPELVTILTRGLRPSRSKRRIGC